MSPFAKLLCGVAFLMLLLPGCSGPTLFVGKGQLRYKDKPLEVKPKTQVTMMFIPVVKGDKPFYYCDFDPTNSTYKAAFLDKGLPAGKYKIAIEQKIPGGTVPPAMKKMNDMFSQENTQIVRELKDEEPINLELSSPTGERSAPGG